VCRVEPRIIKETEEIAITPVLENVIEQQGFLLVRLKCSKGRVSNIQVMVDRPGGDITVGECQFISDKLRAVLATVYPEDFDYCLEVSSPGMDRPLVRRSDFARWSGREAKIALSGMINGNKFLRGIILGYRDGNIGIRVSAAHGEQTDIWFHEGMVVSARLVITEGIIKNALHASKKFARKQVRKK